MPVQREDTFRLALAALAAHKLRTALTLTGLIIGVTSLILVMTLIQGANTYVESKIANLGTDVFQVSRVPLVPVDFDEFTLARKNRDLTLDDLREVEARCVHCLAVGARVETLGRVRTDTQSMTDVAIRGETANMGDISTLDIEDGRFFYEGEARAAAREAVIGASVADKLFAGRNPIGRRKSPSSGSASASAASSARTRTPSSSSRSRPTSGSSACGAAWCSTSTPPRP
jgi:putative ABC transport system permease protein